MNKKTSNASTKSTPYPVRLGPVELAGLDVIATHLEVSKQEALRCLIRDGAKQIAAAQLTVSEANEQ
jgi:hypothetical protein